MTSQILATLLALPAVAQAQAILPWDPPPPPRVSGHLPVPAEPPRFSVLPRAGVVVPLTHAMLGPYAGIAVGYVTPLWHDRFAVEVEAGALQGKRSSTLEASYPGSPPQFVSYSLSQKRALVLATLALRIETKRGLEFIAGAGPLASVEQTDLAVQNIGQTSTRHVSGGAHADLGVEIFAVGGGTVTLGARVLWMGVQQVGGRSNSVSAMFTAGYRFWF